MSANPSTSTKSPHHWIHCNRCGESYIDKEKKLYLLACSHIACETCRIDMKRVTPTGVMVFKCCICKKLTEACEMRNTMPSNLKIMFHPNPFLDGVFSQKIVDFQAEHRRVYLEVLEIEQNITSRKRKYADNWKETYKKKCKEYQELKNEFKQFEKRIFEHKQQNGDDRQNKSFSSTTANTSAALSSSVTVEPKATKTQAGESCEN